MSDFPCTHPEGWPCADSKTDPGSCGTQQIYDVAMGAIDGHYELNPEGSAGVGSIEMHTAREMHKTGWTGNSEVVTLDADEQRRWHFMRPGEQLDSDA